MTMHLLVHSQEQFHLEILRCLREAVQRKRLEAWTNKIWMPHYNNEPAHVLHLILVFFGEAIVNCCSSAALLSGFDNCKLLFSSQSLNASRQVANLK